MGGVCFVFRWSPFDRPGFASWLARLSNDCDAPRVVQGPTGHLYGANGAPEVSLRWSASPFDGPVSSVGLGEMQIGRWSSLQVSQVIMVICVDLPVGDASRFPVGTSGFPLD